MTRLDLHSPLELLRTHPDLRRLLGAQLVSMTGDWALGIGLLYSVYQLTGSTVASAAMMMSGFVPMVLVGLVAGVFVDRWDRKRTMIVTNLLMALALLPLLLVDGTASTWIVYAVMAVESVLEVFFAPAEQAMLPRVVPDEDLVAANGLNGQARDVARLVGAALGGVMVASGGIAALVVFDVASFLVAALLVHRVGASGRAESRPPTDADATEVVSSRLSALSEEWRAGFQSTWHAPVVRTLVVFTVVTSAGEGVMGTLFAPYVQEVLDGTSTQYGLIAGIQAVGGVVGGFLIVSVAHRWSPVAMLGLGAVAFGAVDLAIFLYPVVLVAIWPALLGMLLVGIPGAMVETGLRTLMQRNTRDAERGRVFSLQNLASSVMLMAGATAAGFLGEAVGIMPVLALQGVVYVAAGLMVLATLGRRDASLSPSAALPSHGRVVGGGT